MLCGAGQGVAHRLGLQRPRPEPAHRRGHAAHVAEHGSVRRGAGEVTIPPISLKQTAATATCSPNAWTCARRSGTCRISPAGRFCACWAEPIRENHNKEKPHDKESKGTLALILAFVVLANAGIFWKLSYSKTHQRRHDRCARRRYRRREPPHLAGALYL